MDIGLWNQGIACAEVGFNGYWGGRSGLVIDQDDCRDLCKYSLDLAVIRYDIGNFVRVVIASTNHNLEASCDIL